MRSHDGRRLAPYHEQDSNPVLRLLLQQLADRQVRVIKLPLALQQTPVVVSEKIIFATVNDLL